MKEKFVVGNRVQVIASGKLGTVISFNADRVEICLDDNPPEDVSIYKPSELTEPPRCGGCGCFTGPFTPLDHGKYCDHCYNRRIKGIPPQGFTSKTRETPEQVTAWLNGIYKNIELTEGKSKRRKAERTTGGIYDESGELIGIIRKGIDKQVLQVLTNLRKKV